MSDAWTALQRKEPNSLAGVSVAILAGGLGTRLRAVLADRPKVMAEVCGRPFLTRWLESLEQQGCREVVLCTGHLADQISQWFGSSYGHLTLRYSVENAPLGTGGALRQALALLASDSILVLNGDSFCEVDLSRFYGEQLRRAAPVMMVLTQVDDTSRYGKVNVRPDGRILAFSEKSAEGGPGWINAGIYLIRRELLQAVPEHRVTSLERELFPQWLPNGLFGFASLGRFIDIGTPETLVQAENFFAPLSTAA